MPSQRWERAKGLLEATLGLDAARRRPYLNEACADDSALRHDVESLLLAYESDPGFIESPLIDTRALALAHDRLALVGQRLGPYRIERALGSGGMGTVYLAERADAEYVGRVAVKVIRLPGPADPRRLAEVQRRVRRERQALASLDHPNIARLLDAGATPDGDPYLILEYVEGLPITRYCDESRLSVPDRIALFLAVCAGVHHAHQNLIVHRDLKPANILVTDDGAPKLLDFGIAKILAPEPLDDETTQTPGQPLTPAYASPEQARGEPVTTATDVYTLGVLLYEVLTGRRPLHIEGRPPLDVMRAISEVEPDRPSIAAARPTGPGEVSPQEHARRRGTDLHRLARLLRGDLDSIVLRALHKDPRRRYPSAMALAEDLERHRAGLPVRAHDATLVYRAGKFVRRHAVGVAAAAVIVVALTGGLTGTAWQAHVATRNLLRAREAEHVAAIRAEVASQTTRYLIGLFEEADPLAPGRVERPRHPVEAAAAAEFLRRGERRLASLKSQPAVQAALMAALSRAHASLGAFDRALELADHSLTIRRTTTGGDSVEIAESLEARADVLRAAGRPDEAEPLLQEAIAMRRRLLPGAHPSVADALNTLGMVRKDRGDYDGAEAAFRETLEVQSAAAGTRDDAFAKFQVNLGWLLAHKGEFEEAERVQREALDTLTALHGEVDCTVGAGLIDLGHLFYLRREFEEAADTFEGAARVLRASMGGDDPWLATALNNLGTVYMELANLDAAGTPLEEALAIRRRTLGERHPDVAQSLTNLGILEQRRGELGQAAAHLKRALEIYARAPGAYRADEIAARHVLGMVLLKDRRFAEAEQELRAVLDAYRDVPHPEPARLASMLSGLGQALAAQEKHGTAEPLLRESLAVKQDLGMKPAEIAHSESLVAGSLSALGRYDEAAPLLENAVEVLRRDLGPRHDRTVQAIRRLIAHCEATGDKPRAAALRAQVEHPSGGP